MNFFRRLLIRLHTKIFTASDLRAPHQLARPFEAHPVATTFPPSPSFARVRPAGDTVDSDPGAVFEDDPTLDQALVASWSLECVATLGSRRSSCPA